MDSVQHHKVIIIGSGPAGLTAAIYTGRANLAPLLIHGPLPGGQLTTTTEVENWPGYEHGIMGPELMEVMEKQAKRFGATVAVDTISEVNLNSKPITLKSKKNSFSCDALIVATGATPKWIGLPNEKELLGYGVSTCATCDGAFFKEKIIMVVGGGDSACEEASFLSRFGSKVLLVHRRDTLRASKIMQDRVFKNPKISMIWNKGVSEIIGSRESGVSAVILKDTVNGSTEKVEINGLFIAIGHTPNSGLFAGQLKADENGYLLHSPDSSKTNIPGVFVCGDVQDHVFRQAITAAGSGCMAAIEAERYLESGS